VSHAKPHCRISLQRLREETLASFSLGSRGPAPGILRSLLSSVNCSNSRRMVQPFSSDPPFCAAGIIEPAFASVRLCESEPRMASHVKSMGNYRSFKIPAKIAVSQGCYNPVEVPSSSRSTPVAPLGVGRPNRDRWKGLFVRASAQFFPQICNRAEVRRGHFPLPSPQHQTGPP
jgi:hypothetical protein